MRFLPIAFLLTLTTAASADWQVRTAMDPLTDTSYAIATLAGAGASVRVRCVNGTVMPAVVFDRRVGFYRIGVAYRFDEKPVTSRIVFLGDDARTAWIWLSNEAGALQQLSRSKRFRLQVFPTGADPLFFDFDLTGAKAAIGKVRCR